MSPRQVVDEPERKGCGSFGCLVKAPLGCLSFLFGATVVFVFLLPAAFGRLVGPSWEKEFEERYMGGLTLGEFRLAWFGRQSVDQIVLKDPTGSVVATIELSLPPLYEMFGGDGATLGPIGVELHADLEGYEDGTTNLQRALRRREDVMGTEVQAGGKRFTLDTDFRYELERGTITWTNPEIAPAELALYLSSGEMLFRRDEGYTLALAGSLEDGGRLEFDGEFEDAFALVRGEPMPHRWRLSVDGATTPSLEAVCTLDLPFEAALGSVLTSLVLDASQGVGEEPRLDLLVAGSRASVRLRGVTRPETFASAPRAEGAPTAGQVDFDLGGFWTNEILPALLPIADWSSVGTGTLELASFELPLDGDLARLSAELTLDLDTLAFTLLPSVEELAPGLEAKWHGPAVLGITGGRVGFDDVSFLVGENRVVLAGSYDLVTDTLAATLSGPLEVVEPGGGEGTFLLELSGSAASPTVVPGEPESR